jgi:hypothetical protein
MERSRTVARYPYPVCHGEEGGRYNAYYNATQADAHSADFSL